MANSKTAIKRIRTNNKKRELNKQYKSMVKTYTKKYTNAIAEYKNNPNSDLKLEIQSLLSLAYSKIDKAHKKNIFHKNTASRKKSNLLMKYKAL